MYLHNQIFIIFEYTGFFTLVEGVYGEMKRPVYSTHKIAPNEYQENVKEVMQIYKTFFTSNVLEQLLIILDYTAGKSKVEWWVTVAKLKKPGRASRFMHI